MNVVRTLIMMAMSLFIAASTQPSHAFMGKFLKKPPVQESAESKAERQRIKAAQEAETQRRLSEQARNESSMAFVPMHHTMAQPVREKVSIRKTARVKSSHMRKHPERFIDILGETSQPTGHHEYCRKSPAECNDRSNNTKPVKLTKQKWADLDGTNKFANSEIKPVTDLGYHGKEEYWTIPKTHGDCEDYVLLKRKLLMEKGWPAHSLLVAVVRRENGDGHAVLIARTDHGDMVLDNLLPKGKKYPKILYWHLTNYKYLKMVSPHHSGRWVDIKDSRTLVAGIN